MTREEIRAMNMRNWGVAETAMTISAVYLPNDAPQEVISAWIRLHGQGAKDVDTIGEWLSGE
jgi:hypothetical protein